jgi:hypothetical protein
LVPLLFCFVLFLMVLGFVIKALHLLGRSSVTWAILPTLLDPFFDAHCSSTLVSVLTFSHMRFSSPVGSGLISHHPLACHFLVIGFMWSKPTLGLGHWSPSCFHLAAIAQLQQLILPTTATLCIPSSAVCISQLSGTWGSPVLRNVTLKVRMIYCVPLWINVLYHSLPF